MRHDAERLETSRETFCPALLAANERMRGLHAGKPWQCVEPGPLGDGTADWPGHRHPGGVTELYARCEALQEPLRQRIDGRDADRAR